MLNYRRLTQRGVALLMALMFAMLMGVVARGVFRFTMGAQSRQTHYHERAQQAALSGMEYARSQLARDSDWRGDSLLGTTISSDSLIVREANGNVFGLLIYPDGGKAQFRIRFNYQDGSGGGDGLADPPSGAKIESKLLSINNMDPTESVFVPALDQSNFKVRPGLVTEEKVPGHSAMVVVEGRSGTGIDKLDNSSVTTNPGGYINTVELKSVLKVVLDEPVAPAVLQSAGNMDLVTVEGVTVTSLDNSKPSVRSKQSISVRTPDNKDGPLNMEDGHVWAANSDLKASYNPNDITLHAEQASADLSSLTWEQVTKPNGAACVKLPAGTYVLWPPVSVNGKFPENSNGTLRYYPMDYDTYLQQIHGPYVMQGYLPPNMGLEISDKFAELTSGTGKLPEAVTIENDKVTISQDLYVYPSGGTKDFAIIPLMHGAMKTTEMTSVKSKEGFVSTAPTKPVAGGNLQLQIEDSRIYTEGDMIFKGGSISARGATLIGEGNLQFNTPTLSVVPGESNISLYFKGDINLSSFDKGSQSYGEFKIAGIIYSWGDVGINLGEPGASFETWGNLNFLGSLVAYGADPNSRSPGESRKGAINVLSRAANLTYDPTTVSQLSSPEELNQAILLKSVGSWIRL